MPSSVHSDTPLALPAGRAEHEVLAELRALAGRNQVLTSMIGLGYHGTVTPPVILRNVLENPAWYTAYTPYQPEISQGRLEALLNFQTVVTDLTGLPVAGRRLLDEATAAAEAMTLARRTSKAPADAVFVVDADVLPQTLAVIRTRAEPLGLEVVVADVPRRRAAGPRPVRRAAAVPRATGGACATSPRSPRRPRSAAPLVAVAADLLALTLLRPPGELGADIAVGHHPALRRADGLRRPARRLPGGAARARAAAARPAGRRLQGRRRPPRRTGWPCRPASSTSAARRRPATSAPRRCCSP